MLTLEEFTNIIKNVQKHEQFCKKLSETYPIDIYQIDEVNTPSVLCDIFFNNIYGEEKLDKINYWLYEQDKCYGSTDEEIEELYNEIN